MCYRMKCKKGERKKKFKTETHDCLKMLQYLRHTHTRAHTYLLDEEKKKTKRIKEWKKKLFLIVRVCYVLLFNLCASLGVRFAASFRWVFKYTSNSIVLWLEISLHNLNECILCRSFSLRCCYILFFSLLSLGPVTVDYGTMRCDAIWCDTNCMAKSQAHMWITSSWLFRIINRCVKGSFFRSFSLSL